MPTLDTLIEDINNLLSEPKTLDSFVSSLSTDVAGVTSSRLAERRETQRTLRMSNIGRPLCRLWFDLRNPSTSERIEGSLRRKFLIGDILEQVVLNLAEAAGHSVTDKQRQVSVDGVTGSIDAIIDGVVVDVKSASPYSYQKFLTGTLLTQQDDFGYVHQLGGYAGALGLPAAWLAINKVTGEMCVLRLPEPQSGHLSVAKLRIKEARQAELSETPLPREFTDEAYGNSGNRALCKSCNWCPHKLDCWSDANGGVGLRQFNYSHGPVWLTHVAKEPRVLEEFPTEGESP